MKKVIKTSLVLVVSLMTMVSYGNEISHNVNNKEVKITNLTFENVEKGSVLLIKDSNGLVLYKEFIEVNGAYSKGFDLTDLPDGSYYFELDKKLELSVIPFYVIIGVVDFDMDKQIKIYKPRFYVKEGHLFVNKLSFSEDEVMEIQIYSDTDDLIFKEIIKRKSGVLGRIYDFSNSEKGEYSVVTKTKEKRFVNRIQI
tara:strand:- start:432520 stop:433113 length:594 start_codon:yes stop_codon:yes gene_type:complete